VSEIKNERVEKVSDALSEGQEVKVKVLEIDPRGKVRLSMRVVDQTTGEELEDTRPAREPREGGDRGSRGPRRDGDGGRDAGNGGGGRSPRGEGGGGRDGGDRGSRGPRRDGDGGRDGGNGGGRGPRRDGGGQGGAQTEGRAPRTERSDGDKAPEFAPAFLTGDRD